MAYKTLKNMLILRYGRWIEVEKDHELTENEVDECPNLKAWIRWGLLKEMPEDNQKNKTSGQQVAADLQENITRATETTSVMKPETKRKGTKKLK